MHRPSAHLFVCFYTDDAVVSNEATMARRRYRRYTKSGFKGGFRRSYNYRRRYHRSRYRRYRRFRRRVNRKIEYKRIESSVLYNFTTSSKKIGDLNRYFQIIDPFPYGVYCIGYLSVGYEKAIQGKYIQTGYGYNQRVGRKINPVKLRIYGAINILPPTNVPGGEAAPAYTGQVYAQRVFVRMIVFQVRNGNTEYTPAQEQFSSVNPYVTLIQNGYYNGIETQNYFLDEGWFARMFSKNATMTSISRPSGDDFVEWHGYDLMEAEDPYWQNAYLKSPYRLGIGASVRILKDKLYGVTPQTSQSIPFRFKTKRPSRMVWPEGKAGDDAEVTHPKNPIYIVVIPIFPYPTYPSRVQVDMNFDMFYTDL